MKHVLLLLGLCLSLGFSPLIFSQNTLQNGLVAHFPFDGDMQDQSGNDNHGTAKGAGLTFDRFGLRDSACQFNGNGDHVEVKNQQNLQPGFPVTMAAWVNLEAGSEYNMVFKNCFEENWYHGFWLNVVRYNVTTGFGDGGPVGPSSRRSKLGTTVLTPGTWYHVASIIRGPRDMELYVNGRNDCGSYSGTGGDLAYKNIPGVIGRSDGFSQPGPNHYFQGKIDDVRFYDRELSEEEIQELAGYEPWGIDTLVMCIGEEVTLTARNGNTYAWQAHPALSCLDCASNTISPRTSSEFEVMVFNEWGCGELQQFYVEVDSPCCRFIDLEPIWVEPADCNLANGAAEVLASMGNPPFAYQWNTLPAQTGPLAENLAAGIYEVSVRDSLDCRDTLRIEIREEKTVEAEIGVIDLNTNRPLLLSRATIQFIDQSRGASRILWDFGDGTQSTQPNPIHRYQEPGTYQVCLTAWNETEDCIDKDTLWLEILLPGRIFVPTAFTPNEDLRNDRFMAMGEGVESFALFIFNRWGEKIKTLNSLQDSWDGRSEQGKPVPEGVYVYRLEAVLNGGILLRRSGTITLIR
ncbi:MAG: LamG-like jellyroll fold domain-containing protein [Bacteroidota bacterium]